VIPQVQRPLFEPRVAPATQVVASIDPLVTIGVLLLCVALFRVRFDGAYLHSVLVVFSLTIRGAPNATSVGRWRATSSRAERDIALLLLIGWATSTTETFDQRTLAWLLATPVARFR